MKTEKMSLKSIKNVLSRAEMKKIMAGSSCPGGPCGGYCLPPGCCEGFHYCQNVGCYSDAFSGCPG